MLKPLSQWLCDHCGGLIEQPMDGWVEWLTRESPPYPAHSVRIVHHVAASPLRRHRREGCYGHNDQHGHLESFLGPEGLQRWLARLRFGVFDPEEWYEVAQRLFVPYYEEARTLFGFALKAGWIESSEHCRRLAQEQLLTLIFRYPECWRERAESRGGLTCVPRSEGPLP